MSELQEQINPSLEPDDDWDPQEESERRLGHPRRLTVTINGKSVVFTERRQNGSEIKHTAIQQGLAIKPDFLLFIVKGKGRLDPVGDQETVILRRRHEFRAVAPDDNS